MDEQESDAIIGLLRDHFGSRAKVLEFGTGRSTVAFSTHASSWVAIEHNPEWGARTQAFLGEGSGVRIEVVLPNRPQRGQDAAVPGQFASYIEAGRRFCPEGGYDFVLVDGRARVECMLKLADWGLLRPGSIVALHDLRRERYLEHLDELLRRYRLVSAVTKGSARGLGIFEYRPDEQDEVATRTIAEPARGRTNGRLFVYGFPGLYGGAGTRPPRERHGGLRLEQRLPLGQRRGGLSGESSPGREFCDGSTPSWPLRGCRVQPGREATGIRNHARPASAGGTRGTARPRERTHHIALVLTWRATRD